ncbi:MAG: NAD-dependent epimerase/dehydratase family protein [Patescibacteria group bacterium]|jgi:nucleoside-diphosphate-sugar epimerase
MAKKHDIQFEKKNIIVTGGAGFLGSHLCDLLVKTDRVICVDNFSTGLEINIHHLLKNPDFEFLKHDMTEPLDVLQYEELKKFDIQTQGIQEIYHLASPTSPKYYHANPVETLLANSLGTRNALDLARKHEARIVFFSSAAIYGEPREATPFPEQYWGYTDPVGPRSAYIEGKRFAESLITNYRRVYALEAKIMRVFNTYGSRMQLDDGRMIPDFVRNAMAGKPVTIYGTKDDMVSMVYVSDVLEAAMRLMASHEHGPVNVGNPEQITVGEIAKKIITLLGSPSTIRYSPHLPYTVKQGIPSIHRAKEKLGWFPVVSYDEGLKRTVDALRGSNTIEFNSEYYQENES